MGSHLPTDIKIVVTRNPFYDRIGIIEDGEVVEYFENQTLKTPLSEGSIIKAAVKKILPSTDAVFVTLNDTEEGFLQVKDLIVEGNSGKSALPYLKIGTPLLVQIKKIASKTKSARVSCKIALPGNLTVLFPFNKGVCFSKRIEDESEKTRLTAIVSSLKLQKGVLFRTAAAYVKDEIVKKELEKHLDLWKSIESNFSKAEVGTVLHSDASFVVKVLRDWLTYGVSLEVDNLSQYEEIKDFLEEVRPDLTENLSFYRGKVKLFDLYKVEREIEKALRSRVWLKSGGSIVIENTEALVAIDVNSSFCSTKSSLEETAFKVNIEAAAEIAKQIRLRNLGGIVVVDFLRMDSKKEAQVMEFFKKKLKKDRLIQEVVGFTRFGLVEIIRKRKGCELNEIFFQNCSFCNGIGKLFKVDKLFFKTVINAIENSFGNKKISITLSSKLYDFYLKNREVIDRCLTHEGMYIKFLCDNSFKLDDFSVSIDERV